VKRGAGLLIMLLACPPSLTACSGGSGSAQSNKDPIDLVEQGSHVVAADRSRCASQRDRAFASMPVQATTESTVGQVRDAIAKRYGKAKVPSLAAEEQPSMTVVLCRFDTSGDSNASPPVASVVVAVTSDGNSWIAAGTLG
jgi:hypothetical protein